MNTSIFQQKIAGTGKPIIVDFWANWCAPCRATKPILEKLAKEYAREVEFLPINADDSREILAQFQVIGIPTVLAIRNGEVVGRVTGARNEAEYRAMFDALVEGREVKASIPPFDRMLRLGAGALFVMIGMSTASWVVAVIGGVIAFLGVYDRCPVWAAITGMLQRRYKN